MTQRHPLFSMIASVAAVAVLCLPGMASAEYWHPANNQAGVVTHNEHFKSDKTRAQVKAEAEAATRQGRLSYGNSNYPMPVPDVGTGKTRQQVINELLNETHAERTARLNFMAGG